MQRHFAHFDKQRLSVCLFVCLLVCLFIKPPLATARAASCNWPVRMFVSLSVCLSPNCKNAIFSKTKQFRAMVSIDNLQEIAHGLSKEPIIGPLKSKTAQIRRLGLFCQNAKTGFSQN